MADEEGVLDLLIVGGGINGCGIARDAAGRGLGVALVEQHDLARHTSSASSKLIHGGLRYLEQYEFRLVREALMEREVLLAMAPHIIWPLTFVLPHSPEQRPAWLIRLGLFLYDHLGGRRVLPGSSSVSLRGGVYGAPLQDWVRRGFTYADCWVQDARLVLLNAMAAREAGAAIWTRTRCVEASVQGGLWQALVEDRHGRRSTLRARALVNAAGPWVSSFLRDGVRMASGKAVRLVKGSHIVVPRLYPGEHPYILQNDDRRIVFVIPYEQSYSLVGTTDLPFEGDPTELHITPAETDYLCRVVSRYFRRPLTPDQVVWSYAGVRPLYDDASASASTVTRDYVFDLDATPGRPPLLSIFGGKITTYRRLAEHALERLQPLLGFSKGGWTAGTVLPGGDLPPGGPAALEADFRRRWPWLPQATAGRWARSYGTRAERIVGAATGLDGLGAAAAPGLHEAELAYLHAEEWALTAEDVLWRRSKLGLHLPASTHAAVRAAMERISGVPAVPI